MDRHTGECVQGSYPPSLVGDMGELQWLRYIPRCEDPVCCGAQPAVDLDKAAGIDAHSCILQPQARGSWRPPNGDQEYVRLHLRSVA